ncbi:MAG: ABC transporter ATP-binding protein [Hyphomicrobiaceae bacterium]|nr:ABC transporter ATP-binding protein [Hyphomicrobiaceae bacterium]
MVTSMSKSVRQNAFSKAAKFTWHHWRRQKPWLVLMLTAGLVSTVADSLAPVFAGKLVNNLGDFATDAAGARNDALVNLGIILVLGLIMVLSRAAVFTGIVRFSLRMMPDIVHEAFRKVQHLSSDWHANSFAGSTVRKITRAMWAMDGLNDTIILALFPKFTLLISAATILFLHWPVMGLVVGLGSAIYVVMVSALMTVYIAPAAQLSNAWDTRVGGVLADSVSCNAVVKSFAGEEREQVFVAKTMSKWTKRTMRTWLRHNHTFVIQSMAMWAFRGAILGTALVLAWNGQANAGDLAFVLTLFFVVQGYLQDVGQQVRNLQRTVNEMEELIDIHSVPLSVADRKGAGALKVNDGEIRFDHVTFQYQGKETPLYEDFSITIRAGERVGLVGHSGSGKTTFVKLIQRLYDINDGAILIDGQDIANVTQASLRSQIALVPQEPILFHRTLADNIAYARPGATMKEIVAAAKLANAHDFIEELPKGYGTLVGERGIKLSGGERQRVALARAFLADAPILIFDEATSSLDSVSEHLIQQAAERLMKGRTTLVVAHRLSTVKSMDRLLVFSKGEIVEEGTHATLVGREKGIYRGLYQRQAMELVSGVAAE